MTRQVNSVLWNEWRQRLKRQRESGLSITAFCRGETRGQRGRLHPQPSQHAPDRTVVQGPFFHGGRPRRRPIAGRSVSRAGRLSVGLPIVLQVAAGKAQEGRAGVALIGEYESPGNR